MIELLASLRGARVEVDERGRIGRPAGCSASSSGRTIRDEATDRRRPDGGHRRRRHANVRADPSVRVRIVERDLRQESGGTWMWSASTREQDVRSMVISTTGTGDAPLFVSYISEVPIWKTTYRLVIRRGRRSRCCRDGRSSTTRSARTGGTSSCRSSRARRSRSFSRSRSRTTRAGRWCRCRATCCWRRRRTGPRSRAEGTAGRQGRGSVRQRDPRRHCVADRFTGRAVDGGHERGWHLRNHRWTGTRPRRIHAAGLRALRRRRVDYLPASRGGRREHCRLARVEETVTSHRRHRDITRDGSWRTSAPAAGRSWEVSSADCRRRQRRRHLRRRRRTSN